MISADIVFVHALTSVHVGTGTGMGAIDLPIQREHHTQWPTIPGSSLKGIARDACRESVRNEKQLADDGDEIEVRDQKSGRMKANEDSDLTAAFGPGSPGNASDFAGAISFTDARILALPVRSLQGVYAWVTCPSVLERMARNVALVGICEDFPTIPNADSDWAICDNQSKPLLPSSELILEELRFVKITDPGVIDWVSRRLPEPKLRERLKERLVVVSDDRFKHFAIHAMEIVARIALDFEKTKTVKKGALFYQELLPAESLMYSLVLANDSRRKDHPKPSAKVLEWVRKRLKELPFVQIGGDETTGKGLCKLHFCNGITKHP